MVRKMFMNIAVYPGSFDPVTNGHLDIIRRSAELYDKLVVAVLNNSAKRPLFSSEERVELIRRVTGDLPNVTVEAFSGLLIDFVRNKGARVVIKGLRAVSDFEYEFQMALLNKQLCGEVESLFMVTSSKYSYISSSIIKEVAGLGGSLDELVPPEIVGDLLEKLGKGR